MKLDSWTIQKIERWRSNPNEFFRDVWGKDILLWDKLEQINNNIVNHRRVVIPSGHGVGKTWNVARLALWFLVCFPPAKVITTAPTWPQVKSILWAELTKAYNSALIPIGGEMLTTRLNLREDWFAIGLSTREEVATRDFGAAKFQGFHSPNLLIILDEGAGVSHAIWVASENLITGQNNKIVAIGNPMSPTGDFYEKCKSPLWHKIKISCFDHPNIKTGKNIIPGAVTKEWIKDRQEEWGESSPLWQAKVLGEFPTEGTDTLIPLSWAETSALLNLKPVGDKKFGADLARYGADMTVFTAFHGGVQIFLDAFNKKDLMWAVGKTLIYNKQYKFQYMGGDDSGLGGGYIDRLLEQDIDIEPLIFGAKAIESDKFFNLKAEMYWVLRDAIKNKEIKLIDDKELINQLSSIKYSYTSKGQIKIESKDDMKKRGLKSPDKADATAIAWYCSIKKNEPVITIL